MYIAISQVLFEFSIWWAIELYVSLQDVESIWTHFLNILVYLVIEVRIGLEQRLSIFISFDFSFSLMLDQLQSRVHLLLRQVISGSRDSSNWLSQDVDSLHNSQVVFHFIPGFIDSFSRVLLQLIWSLSEELYYMRDEALMELLADESEFVETLFPVKIDHYVCELTLAHLVKGFRSHWKECIDSTSIVVLDVSNVVLKHSTLVLQWDEVDGFEDQVVELIHVREQLCILSHFQESQTVIHKLQVDLVVLVLECLCFRVNLPQCLSLLHLFEYVRCDLWVIGFFKLLQHFLLSGDQVPSELSLIKLGCIILWVDHPHCEMQDFKDCGVIAQLFLHFF